MISTDLLLFLSFTAVAYCADLDVLTSWKYLDYTFPSIEAEAQHIEKGYYSYQKNVPVDVEVAPDGRVFVTVERLEGVPSSLNTLSTWKGTGGDFRLSPYPSWMAADTRDCNNIIAVFRITIDKCNRLWVVDSGTIGNDSICPPKLMIFDLGFNTLIRKIDIPEDLVRTSDGVVRLVTIVVNVENDCLNAKAYMADSRGYGLLVWDGKKFFRIESENFEPDSNADEFNVAGKEFKWKCGINGLALSQDPADESSQLLYFSPLTSYMIYSAKTSDLLESRGFAQESIEYTTQVTGLSGQTAVHVMSSKGILFFSSVGDNSILCWNRHKRSIPTNIVEVARNDETLQWTSGMKIHPSPQGEVLWIMTNRYQNMRVPPYDFTDVNFRILAGFVKDLIKDTNCE